MSELKATPGPWEISHVFATDPCYIAIDAPKHGALAEVVWKMEDEDRSQVCEANAHLIAAAPDLYDALEWAMRFVDQVRIENPLPEGGGEDIAYQRAIHALAKARGES